MTLMQYPVSHSPPFPRRSTLLKKKKQWGWRDHTIIELSQVEEAASKGEGAQERMETQDSRCCDVRESWCALALMLTSCQTLIFFINDTTVHVEMLLMKMFSFIFYEI